MSPREYFVAEEGAQFETDLDTGYFVVLRKNCTIGYNVKLWSNTVIDESAVIDNDVRIQCNCYIAQYCYVGPGVFIGPGTQLLNDKYPPRFNKDLWEPVVVEADAVIGGGVTILPGIRVGKKALIGGGSVVTKDVPAGETWVGNPARKLR